jgi:tRNA(fMet)-specific endonuclease VapC
MRVLLDTDVCIEMLRGNPRILDRVAAGAPDDFGVSTVTAFELFSGAERCRNPTGEARRIGLFLEPLHVLPFDRLAAREAARIRWTLERAGRPIGPYDLMIAAQAVTLDLPLVTHNRAEFGRVAGLRIEDWLAAGDGSK